MKAFFVTIVAMLACCIASSTYGTEKSGFIVVPFVARSEAYPGEKISVVLEIYNWSDREVLVPDPEKLDLSFDHISTGKEVLLGPLILDGPAAPLVKKLKPGAKLAAKKDFVVPKCTGVLLIRSIEWESARTPLRVLKRNETEPNKAAEPTAINPPPAATPPAPSAHL